MNSPPTAHALSAWDEARPAEPDPNAWSANLAVLRSVSPDLAHDLESTPLPNGWRCRVALDGALSFRLENAGEAPLWLGGTAAPSIRAAGLFAKSNLKARNAALPTAGSGRELEWLCENLPAHIAVFVLEADLVALSAVLRILNISASLRAFRAILIHPAREHEHLRSLLNENPGLQPPAMVVSVPAVSAERIEHVYGICARVGTEVVRERDAALAALERKRGATCCVGDPVRRIALVSRIVDPRLSWLARGLEARAPDNRKIRSFLIETPKDVHPLAHQAAIADFAPDRIVSLNQEAASSGVISGSGVAEWFLDEGAVPQRLSELSGPRLAATPRIAALQRRRGASAGEIACFPWPAGCGSDSANRTELDMSTVAILGNLPDDSPDRYRIEQPTLRQLWRSLRTVVEECWETDEIRHPERLLRRAEQARRFHLPGGRARRSILRLLRRVLIPAVVAERICRLLESRQNHILRIGAGWNRLATKTAAETLPRLLTPASMSRRAAPRLCVLLGTPDPPLPDALIAASSGWPLAAYVPRGAKRRRIAGVLKRRRHFATFFGMDALLKLLRESSASAEARAEETQRFLERHTFERRAAALFEQFARQRGREG